jgi:hypothetical protein
MSVHSEGKRHFLCKMQNSPTTPAGVETEQTSQKLKEVIRYLPKLLLRKALSDPGLTLWPCCLESNFLLQPR